MKLTKLLLLSLSVIAMLFAGGCAYTNAHNDDLVSSSELASQSPETTKPSAPSTDDALVEKLTSTDNTPDESFISADYATEQLLEQYQSYDEFNESEDIEYQVKVLFKVGTEVKDVRFLEIFFDENGESGDVNFYVSRILYSKDKVSPEKPLVVGTVFHGDFPTRGISFVDENNTTRYYSLNMSGRDGSLILLELVPREDA
jgi:hypothetical protein